jgi:hypothetical protein
VGAAQQSCDRSSKLAILEKRIAYQQSLFVSSCTDNAAFFAETMI